MFPDPAAPQGMGEAEPGVDMAVHIWWVLNSTEAHASLELEDVAINLFFTLLAKFIPRLAQLGEAGLAC